MGITFIQTGGTIDKDYPRPTMGYAFEITDPAVGRVLEVLDPDIEFTVISLFRKDSLDITPEDRELLVRTCLEVEDERIVISHGTDTMIETAEFLAKTFIRGSDPAGTMPASPDPKTIVITGAVKPERFKDSDAHANIGAALGAVQSLEKGIYIVMHGMVLPWDGVVRDHVTGRFSRKKVPEE